MWSVQWMDNEPHEVSTVMQINQILDSIAAIHGEHNPALVQVRSPSGEVLMVGIGGELSVLDYIAAGGWPSQHSVGEPSDDTIPYTMGSYHSEMPKEYAVSHELARKAVEHFFRTGQLLPEIAWEND